MTKQPTIETILFNDELDDAYVTTSEMSIKFPERSEWACYMFGNRPNIDDGIKYIPRKGLEPNFFVRWMMKVCFDCTWVKEKKT